MQCLLAFLSHWNYDSFVDYYHLVNRTILKCHSWISSLTQRNFIFNDVEDIIVVFWLFVRSTKHLSYTVVCIQQLVLWLLSMHANRCAISLYMENGYFWFLLRHHLYVRITHICMLWNHESKIHGLFVSPWVAHLKSYFVLWSGPQLHYQWSPNPPFLRRG